MAIPTNWRRRAVEFRSRWRQASAVTGRLSEAAGERLNATASVAGEAYAAALSWKNNNEFSKWLSDHFSDQHATIASKAMDAEYLRTHIGGSWHRIYDGGHSLIGSWDAISTALPDLSAFEQIGLWANEYWKDLITSRGMPIITFDNAGQLGEYYKHLDCINVAEAIGGELCGVSIYCNWNNPAKLVASATATECSGIVYANVVGPLTSLIALGRAYFLLRQAEQNELQDLLAPTLKGLSRSGASILLISIVPGGFLLHLSSGIVISLAHGYVWDKANENRESIFAAMKECLSSLRRTSTGAPALAIAAATDAPQPDLPFAPAGPPNCLTGYTSSDN